MPPSPKENPVPPSDPPAPDGWPPSLRIYDRLLRGLQAPATWWSGRGPERSKVALGIRGRARDAERFRRWGAEGRDRGRPLAWFHAPSVGEGLQARAVLEALRAARPDLQIAFTHFSPSAEGLAARMPAEVAGYLPWDTRPSAEGMLSVLRPSLLAFTKTEVWPVLALSAARGGVPVALVAATLPEESGRRSWAGRRFLGPAFRALARLCAVSGRDGERFLELGVDPERVVVTGDPGIDSAWERAAAADPEAPYLAPFHRSPRPTLVAGSTWPADERILVRALTELRDAVPDLRVVVAPHEPDEAHLGPLEGALVQEGWRPLRLGRVEAAGDAGQADAVVVDRVGVLAHLYTVGRVAYVGGGFHRHGLHSVLEPAAAGVPVLFGPRFGSSLAAEELRDRGGAAAVKDAEELARVAASWLSDPERGGAAGRRGRDFLEEHRGASGRTVEALLPLLP